MGVHNCGIVCARTMYKRNRSYLNLLFYDLSGRFENMVCFFRAFNCANGRRILVVILAFVWVSGLFLGLGTALFADPSFLGLLHKAPVCPVSFGGCFIGLLLPLLFTALSTAVSCHWLLIPLAFARAFLWSALSCGIVLAYGSGGWLVAVLFLFSHCLCNSALLWVWLRLFMSKGITRIHHFAVLAVFLFVCFLDFWHISPFLANLLL